MIGLEGATCNTALIPEMEEIGANILLAEHIGRALVVGSEPADRLDVDVPGPLGKAGKPHVVDHTLTQRGHGRSPFGFKRQDAVADYHREDGPSCPLGALFYSRQGTA